MALVWDDLGFQCDGVPQVVVALEWLPPETASRARAEARELREDGWLAVFLDPATSIADDALHRAGLAWVTGLSGARRVADARAAFEALLAGERVITGPAEAVEGLHRVLALADASGAWRPIELPEPWRARGDGAELLAYSAVGGDVDLTPPPGAAVHLLDPASGDVLGIVAAGDEPRPVRAGDEPLAVYCGPNRFAPLESVTRPE